MKRRMDTKPTSIGKPRNANESSNILLNVRRTCQPLPVEDETCNDIVDRKTIIHQNQNGKKIITTTVTNKLNITNSKPLALLCLAKSWSAALSRAETHPNEAGYGYISSGGERTLLSLFDDVSSIGSSTSNKKNVLKSSSSQMASTPLALACRYGAPAQTIKAILLARPSMVRRCIPNRGTPIHEAIMCPYRKINGWEYLEVIRMLLKADEELYGFDGDDKRATLAQDIDGNVPLHLLIRKSFYSYLPSSVEKIITKDTVTCISTIDTNSIGELCRTKSNLYENDEDFRDVHPLMQLIACFIRSSPESVSIRDFREYEETPLIVLLKSTIDTSQQNLQQRRGYNMHRNNLDSLIGVPVSDRHDQDGYYYHKLVEDARMELKIFKICKAMLQAQPAAASLVMADSGYTALHSTVFHGRCYETLSLVINADRIHRCRQMQEQNVKKDETAEFITESNDTVSPSPMSRLECKSTATDTISNSGPIAKLEVAAIRANSLGECALHLATMRGECTRLISLLSKTAPGALFKRDDKLGLTPLHWLWVRFVDVMLEQFGRRHFEERAKESKYRGLTISNKSPNSHSTLEKSQVETSKLTEKSIFEENDKDNVSSPSLTSLPQPLSSPVKKPTERDDDLDIQFDLEYQVRTKYIDPPVDYMRMRQILPVHKEVEDLVANRVVLVLEKVRERHFKISHIPKPQKMSPSIDMEICKAIEQRPLVYGNETFDKTLLGDHESEQLEEQMVVLFWVKVISLLEAAAQYKNEAYSCDLTNSSSLVNDENFNIIHTVCSSFCSPFSIVRICMRLYSQQLQIRDSKGKLPLHHAASRIWDPREISENYDDVKRIKSIPFDSGLSNSTTDFEVHALSANIDEINGHEIAQDNLRRNFHQHIFSSLSIPENIYPISLNRNRSRTTKNCSPLQLIEEETSNILKYVLASSPHQAARTYDNERRLPIHCAIDTIIESIASSSKSKQVEETYLAMADFLKAIVRVYPESLERRDGRTRLYPFMQAAAVSSMYPFNNAERENAALSVSFSLLRDNPSLAVRP